MATPQIPDYQSQSFWNANATLDDWIPTTPNDPQVKRLSDEVMTTFEVPVQTEVNQGRLLQSPQAGPGLATSNANDVGENPILNSNPTTNKTPLQRLLGLQSTLQKISTSSKDEVVRGFDDARPLSTAIEDTFMATDELVAVIEELHRQTTREKVHP
jgi:hypothetical protein